MAMETMLLSLPDTMGMGPIKITPPVLTLLLLLLSVFPDERKVLPMNIRSIPTTTATMPIKMIVCPLIIFSLLF